MSRKINSLKLKCNKGYTTTGVLIIISILAVLSIIVIPKVSVFKAKGQQSESRINLFRVYKLMYAYKLEHGGFINTKNKVIAVSNVAELSPYIKDELVYLKNNHEKMFLVSDPHRFAIAFVRVLNNGHYDIQRVNSKKVFCYMFNGLEEGTEKCAESQIYLPQSSKEDMEQAQKLKLLKDD
jgi:Tfp pilus assembly protein PilE